METSAVRTDPLPVVRGAHPLDGQDANRGPRSARNTRHDWRLAHLGHDASLGGRWRRRAVTLPAYFLACALLPSIFVLTLAWDLVRDRRFPATRGALAVEIYLFAECAGVVASLALWVVHRAGTVRYERAHVLLQRRWASTLFRSLERLFALQVAVEVEHDEPPHGPSVCLVRHASLADTLVPVVLVAGRWDLAPRYALKRELLADPCLDIVGQRLPNAFLSRSAAHSGDDARAIERLARDLGASDTLVIYPEGTLFTPAKLARRAAELAPERRERLAALRRVLPPRPRGAHAALAACPDACVLLVAHSGLEGLRSLRDLFDGSLIGRRVEISIRRLPAARVPRELEPFTAWLDEAWLEVDSWVSARG